MARRKVDLRPAALRDLLNIATYIIDNHGFPRTATAYVNRIEHQCLQLGDMPFIGRRRDDIGEGIRAIPFEGVLIVYPVTPSRILIHRVAGQAQQIDKTLLKRWPK